MMSMTITFDTETIRLITLFENLTNVAVKDCVMDEDKTVVYFVIEEGYMGRAIGKNGNSIKRTKRLIKKNVKIFEFSKDVDKFIKNLIPQVNFAKVITENNRAELEIWIDKKYKATVIGRDAKNLKVYKELLQRNHDINDITIR